MAFASFLDIQKGTRISIHYFPTQLQGKGVTLFYPCISLILLKCLLSSQERPSFQCHVLHIHSLTMALLSMHPLFGDYHFSIGSCRNIYSQPEVVSRSLYMGCNLSNEKIMPTTTCTAGGKKPSNCLLRGMLQQCLLVAL